MTEATNGAEAPGAGIAASEGPLTIEQAAAELSRERATEQPQDDKAPQRAPDGKFAKAETESAPVQGQDAAPGETPPSGEDAGDEPAPEPPIEPPRSWTAEQRDKFASLPREAQEIIADRENARDAELRRTQNATAEERKATEAQREAATQERVKAEQATAQAAQLLTAELMRDFGDIKTHEDVIRLATDDPFRYSQYQARREATAQVIAQHQQLQQERQNAEVKSFHDWAAKQDEQFSGKFKEFADPVKAEKARSDVVKYLTEIVGVEKQALPELWSNPVFRDARFQQVVYDAARFNAAQERAKAATAVPKPPVQRPGSGSSQSAAQSDVQRLEAQFDKATTTSEQIRIGAALTAAQRRAARG